MKASSRPFKAKHDGGRCPICRRRISKGALIVRLERVVTWIEQKRLVPNGRGRFFVDQQSSQYAHSKCLDERKEAKDGAE
jgi:hypothetical protein